MCEHAVVRAVYQQRPKAEGRVFKAVADRCVECGAFVPRSVQADGAS